MIQTGPILPAEVGPISPRRMRLRRLLALRRLGNAASASNANLAPAFSAGVVIAGGDRIGQRLVGLGPTHLDALDATIEVDVSESLAALVVRQRHCLVGSEMLEARYRRRAG
jgi:hypothetical protein